MRVLIAACLLLAGCATQGPPPERLAGCWIARGENATRTMRWLPDPERPGVLRGALLRYSGEGVSESVNYTLEPRGEGWVYCTQAESAASNCLEVAQGGRGSLEGGRVFIDSHRDGLRISVLGAGPERVLFRGQRDGCD